MSLVFAGVLPHSPVTLPTIGKNQMHMMQGTTAALQEFEGELYMMQPETILVVSPKAVMMQEAFAIHLADEFAAKFADVGDPSTSLIFKADMELVSKLRSAATLPDSGIRMNVIDERELDFGTAVPLFHLTQHQQQYKVVPLSISLQSPEIHFAYGQFLRRVANDSNKRIALLTSAELSQVATTEAKTYDHKINEMIESGSYDQITKLNEQLIIDADAVHHHRALCILFGALDAMGSEAHILSYERPFDAGWLVAQFNLV